MEELEKQGIKIEVKYEGRKLIPEEDGYLGKTFETGQFELRCFMEKGDRVPFCLMVDGKKNVTRMKDQSLEPEIALFVVKIPIEKSENGTLITRYPVNNLRPVLFGEKGKFKIWEIAIISQNGLFFLTKQMTYEAQFFRGNQNELLCPQFDGKWPQLVEILKPLMEKEELLSISTYNPPPVPKREIPQKHGIVAWWNCAQGLGTIWLDEKRMARVHWRGITGNQRLKQLFPGQLVSFQKLLLPSSERTGFLMEAREVRPVE